MSRKDVVLIIVVALSAVVSVVSLTMAFDAKAEAAKAVKEAHKPMVPLERINLKAQDVKIPDTIFFAGERVPIESIFVKERLEQELISNAYFHSNTMVMTKLAHRWFPIIEPILEEYGIPEDFKYMPIIESRLSNAVSPAGAVGFWQLMQGTALEYGLQIDNDVDMRYDVVSSTEAACKFLNKAHDRFGSWSLAAAAYNAGSKRISDFMKNQKVNSYYELLLSEETQRYVFRMVAVKLIMEDLERYGYILEDELFYPELQYKTLTIKHDVNNWTDYAQKHGISYKMLKNYNPWLRSNQLKVPAGKKYKIKMPVWPFNVEAKDFEEGSRK